jgi:hypothetical protein
MSNATVNNWASGTVTVASVQNANVFEFSVDNGEVTLWSDNNNDGGSTLVSLSRDEFFKLVDSLKALEV